MIPLLLGIALLFFALPGTVVPVLSGIADGPAPVLAEDLFRLALATALRLLVHRLVSGRHRDFR